jgi:hypothetical protein
MIFSHYLFIRETIMENPITKTSPENNSKPYVPPAVIFEIDLEASAGGTAIGGSAPFDPTGGDTNYNPWSIP